MRRIFLPLLVCTLWLASLAGAQWARAQCLRACAQTAAQLQQEQVDEGRPCCAKHAAAGRHAAKHDDCAPADCPKCQAVAKALLALAPAPDAPLFFDALAGRIAPVVVASPAPVFTQSRAWRWSLPPPDTLLTLHCSLVL